MLEPIDDIIRLLALSLGGINIGLGYVILNSYLAFYVRSSDSTREEKLSWTWASFGGLGYVLMMIATIVFLFYRLGEDNAVLFSIMLLGAYVINIIFCLKVAAVVKRLNEQEKT